jgi:hypothetical protein
MALQATLIGAADTNANDPVTAIIDEEVVAGIDTRIVDEGDLDQDLGIDPEVSEDLAALSIKPSCWPSRRRMLSSC